MLQSMFSGVAGLRAHQTMMDVVGNNIANVNTIGYKASDVTFQEALTEVMQGPSAGVNPTQVGLGVKVAGTDPVFTQGATQTTGRATDLAIQGSGFFVVQQGSATLYTRAGSFNTDATGHIVTADGAQLMGWPADANGVVNTNQPVTPLSVPIGQVLPSKTTSTVDLGGNLSADATPGTAVTKSINVYDSTGKSHALSVTFTNTGVNAWTASATIDGTAVTISPSATTFGPDGVLTSASLLAVSGFTPPGANPMAFNIDLGSAAPLVQYGGASTVEVLSQDGRPTGNLQGISIGVDGTISGQFSNGQTSVLGQVALASFANPAGLVKVGNSDYSSTINSGTPLVGAAGKGSRGTLTAGALEMSNVDLSQEFTNMIIAERGFQANSRVITTSDEMLNDLVTQLKR